MVGLKDHLSSDLSCSANVQGDNHIDRTNNWVKYVLPYLSGFNGTLPSRVTADYVVGSSHNAYTIVNSDPGIQRLFLDDYNGLGKDAAPPPSNGKVQWILHDQEGTLILTCSSYRCAGYTSGLPASNDLIGSSDSAFTSMSTWSSLPTVALFSATLTLFLSLR